MPAIGEVCRGTMGGLLLSLLSMALLTGIRVYMTAYIVDERRLWQVRMAFSGTMGNTVDAGAASAKHRNGTCEG